MVKGLSAFYSWGLCSCRDGVVCFFICASVLFSRAAGTPSKKRRYMRGGTLTGSHFCTSGGV